jgi:16S rRNA (guanine966-N2)-methyltransferase
MSSLRITAGTLRGRRVAVPPREVRPTSERARQAYFNIVGGRIAGARFLDLFAGSGIFSFEAVSRGAASSTAVEENRKNAAAIEELAAEWKAPVTVVARDVFKVLPKLGTFDLVYADPPYDFGRYDELVEAAGTAGGLIAVEHRRGVELPVDGDTREYGEVSITFFSR